MKFSKQYLNELSLKTNFIKDNIEKVLRLTEILKYINYESKYKGKFVLKGGTAINLLFFNMPRLSVDIDLDFCKNLSKEEVEKVKTDFSSEIINYMENNDYSLTSNIREHFALSSFEFSYINNGGNRDNIKIEINYIDRCHLLPFERKKIKCEFIDDNFEVLTLNKTELFASKINALISRFTPRDLYDVNKMIDSNIIGNIDLLRKCTIFYNMIGGNQDIMNLDYNNILKIDYNKIKRQLIPVLSKKDNFELDNAKEIVIGYLKKLFTVNESEKEFIELFMQKIYKPELLFDNEISENIIDHPMAKWRCK